MRAIAVRRTMTMILAVGTTLGLAAWLPQVAAAESERAQKWQGSIPLTFTSGANYDKNGTSVDLNDDLGWGFGFGYNINERFLVGSNFTWLSASYEATGDVFDNGGSPTGTYDVSGTLDATNWQIFGQWNILKGKITPFLQASFGWTWIDSNIPTGLPQTGCWWDPWYGYICNTYQPTYEATPFAYGASAGVHAEIGDRFYLEGSYNYLWVDFSNAGTQGFDGFRLNVGWMF